MHLEQGFSKSDTVNPPTLMSVDFQFTLSAILLFLVLLLFGDNHIAMFCNYSSHNAFGDVHRKYNVAMELRCELQLEPSYF